MRRAAVLLGVGRHPALPPLHAVRPGLDEVAAWAHEQGFDRVETLTDERGPLGVRAVQDVVADVVRAARTDQLLVYFAGHGVNVGRREFWLLSDAPRYPNEAVDVARSAELAESSGIPHVVLVSDACRTAASGIGWQDVGGSPVFPNEDLGAPDGFVDRFHACALGSPAHEVATVSDAVRRYHAVYTEALVAALRGEAEPALEREGTVALVRPWPLRSHLEQEVGRRLAQLVGDRDLVQIPGARIGSPPGSWLSRIEDAPPAPRTRGTGSAGPGGVSDAVAQALREQVTGDVDGPAPALRDAAERGVPGAAELLAAVERVAAPFPGTGPATSGVVVRGAAVAVAEEVAEPRPDGTLSVLVELADRTGAVLPVLRGYVTEVTVEDGGIVDVGFEPVGDRADPRRRALRALAGVASRYGVLAVPPDLVDALVGAATGDPPDPSLAVLTAYALAGTPDRERIDDLAGPVHALPDLRLLTGRPPAGPGSPVAADVPLLAEGLLLGPSALRHHLVPSLWTHLTPDGVRLVRDARLPRRPA